MLKLKITLLCIMISAALYTGAHAIAGVNSLRDAEFPKELYSSYNAGKETAEYYLKIQGGLVTVFKDSDFKEPLRITEIQEESLRKADRAMLRKGIPVQDRTGLLKLLEDLGS